MKSILVAAAFALAVTLLGTPIAIKAFRDRFLCRAGLPGCGAPRTTSLQSAPHWMFAITAPASPANLTPNSSSHSSGERLRSIRIDSRAASRTPASASFSRRPVSTIPS